jgi:putative ABC transport system permease protein
MIKNYLKIAWRNLVRQKLFSLINISGLAIGLAVCMLIMLYVAHEHSYDRFQKNAERIFIPVAQLKMNGSVMNLDYMSYAAGPLISQGQPTVEGYMRTLGYFKPVIASNPSSDRKFSEKKLVFADPNFFKFFSFRLLSGDPSNVLTKPFSVVISQDMAKKYFGDENPIGKLITLKTDSAYTYQVTGVAENCPSNSSIEYNFVASGSSFLTMKEARDYLGSQEISFGSFNVYLLLKHASDTTNLRRSLNMTIKRSKDSPEMKFLLRALPDIHLHFNGGDQSNIKYLKIFPLVAVLILLLALVNYMSLSTARATLRAKEIGVRKVSGASRKSVAAQFYVESGLYAVLSFVLGYLICYMFKPVFLNVLQLKIDNTFLYNPLVLTLLGVLLLVTILVAGSYPSLVLSAFNPIVSLKGKMSKQSGGVAVRKVFTTLQFAISVGLIICGIIIDRQLYYFRHADTGVNRDNIVMIPVGASFGKNYASFNHDIKSLAGIANVATSRYAMFTFYDDYEIEGKTKDQNVMLNALSVDNNFMSLVGLKWKYPPLSASHLTGDDKVVINELAIEKLHLSGNPVGTLIKSGSRNIEIVGVVKNFNFGSMEYPVQPLGLFIVPDTHPYWTIRSGCNLFAKIKPHTNLPTLLSSIESIYKKYDKDAPFNYMFMDDSFNAQYKAEDRLASIFSIFTVLTIILAGMGLFGLAAFTIEQRTKEIGIRKILGASLSSISALLSKDFLKLVLLAILIASPIAWWAMHNWLQNFAYRIHIQWWMFASAGLLAIIIAIVTVSYHALKAAIANPVSSLRSE